MSMPWQLRHEGSPQAVRDLSAEQIEAGLRDGALEPTDEVRGPGEAAWQALENHPRFAEVAAEVEQPPRARHEEPTHLDMNALIDVCLVLLIFFILTTTYVTTVQKVVEVPTLKMDGSAVQKVSAARVKDKMIRLQASLDSAGKLVIRLENQTIAAAGADGATLDPAKLREALTPYVQGAERKREVLLDARDITWGTVIAIQDAAKSAGVHTVHHLLKK